MNLVEQLKKANMKPEAKEPTATDMKGDRHIKAVVITLLNDGEACFQMRKLLNSIRDTKSKIEPLVMNATVPGTIPDGLKSIREINATTAKWTWPTNSSQDGLDLKTGLYKRTYKANDQNKVIACMVSHMRAWQYCIDVNEPIMVLESDALFTRKFLWKEIMNPERITPNKENWEKWKKDSPVYRALINQFSEERQRAIWNSMMSEAKLASPFNGGILGLNSPFGATRKSTLFFQNARDFGCQAAPTVDSLTDPPLPQGIAGNSAYIIKPWAAKKLFAMIDDIGMWPNDALMCKQLFPWIQIYFPYFTMTQGGASSTTS